MPVLAQQRCFNHLSREAAARCRECQRYYCRECVTEHDGRLICAACLKASASPAVAPRQRLLGLWRALQLGASLALLWSVFYLIGLILLHTPSEVHEGTVWKHFTWLN